MAEELRVRISDFKPVHEYWEATDFVIEDGQIITIRKPVPATMF